MDDEMCVAASVEKIASNTTVLDDVLLFDLTFSNFPFFLEDIPRPACPCKGENVMFQSGLRPGHIAQ
jgi:hypothetical protein